MLGELADDHVVSFLVPLILPYSSPNATVILPYLLGKLSDDHVVSLLELELRVVRLRPEVHVHVLARVRLVPVQAIDLNEIDKWDTTVFLQYPLKIESLPYRRSI